MNLQELTISNISCQGCVKMVSKRLSKIPDVASVEVNLDGKAFIQANRTIAPDEIKSALNGTNYELISS